MFSLNISREALLVVLLLPGFVTFFIPAKISNKCDILKKVSESYEMTKSPLASNKLEDL